jgi:hypothetical protein
MVFFGADLRPFVIISQFGGLSSFCLVRLELYPALRQRLLQFGDSRVGDLGAIEDEPFQIGQLFEMHQPRVGDCGSWGVG